MPDTAQMPPTRYYITRNPEGKVNYHGVDRGGFGTVVAENDKVLVVKWPAGKHWVARGRPPQYHSPSTEVLRKDEDGMFTLLVSWSTDRRKREQTKSSAG